MAYEILVGAHLSVEAVVAGKALLLQLEKEMPIVGAFWQFISDSEVWKLVIASPDVREEGPRKIYSKIQRAILRNATGSPFIGINSIVVIEHTKPLIKHLRTKAKSGVIEPDTRYSSNIASGQFVEDIHLYKIS